MSCPVSAAGLAIHQLQNPDSRQGKTRRAVVCPLYVASSTLSRLFIRWTREGNLDGLAVERVRNDEFTLGQSCHGALEVVIHESVIRLSHF